jgi:hypothetical protein
VIYDPWKTPVAGGQYAYLSKGGGFIRVVPCGGRSHVPEAARLRLRERASKPLVRLVINVDPDVPGAGTAGSATGLRLQDVLQLARVFDASAAINAAGEIDLDGGSTKVSLVRWEAADPPGPGLPDQQTLERLASAALVGAYPLRAKAVQDWLDARATAPAPDPKEHAWSYMAGWYAERGCEAFYSNLWQDPQPFVSYSRVCERPGHGRLLKRWPVKAPREELHCPRRAAARPRDTGYGSFDLQAL